jgi:hypothetical protein
MDARIGGNTINKKDVHHSRDNHNRRDTSNNRDARNVGNTSCRRDMSSSTL